MRESPTSGADVRDGSFPSREPLLAVARAVRDSQTLDAGVRKGFRKTSDTPISTRTPRKARIHAFFKPASVSCDSQMLAGGVKEATSSSRNLFLTIAQAVRDSQTLVAGVRNGIGDL